MAETVQTRWDCNNDEAIQRSTYANGKEDDVQPVIYKSHDHEIIDNLI